MQSIYEKHRMFYEFIFNLKKQNLFAKGGLIFAGFYYSILNSFFYLELQLAIKSFNLFSLEYGKFSLIPPLSV